MLLNYTEFGRGRPIIILHGLFGSSRNWQGIAKNLSNNYHVITPDLRNHGQSAHTDTMSYHDMADDILVLINSLNLNDAILIGHSMGGKVAMTSALTNSEKLSGLIIVDIAPVNYEHDFNSLLDAMNSLPLSEVKSRSDAESHLSQFINSQNLVHFIIQNLVRTEDYFDWRINLQQINTSLPELIQFPESLKGTECHLPSLFIGGTDSNYLRNIYNPAIFEYFPAAEIKMIENAGHWLHADKPHEFLTNVKSFLNYV